MVNCFLLMVSALGGVPPVSFQPGKQLCRHSSADDSGLSLGPPSRKPLKLGPELCLRPLFLCLPPLVLALLGRGQQVKAVLSLRGAPSLPAWQAQAIVDRDHHRGNAKGPPAVANLLPS